MCRLASCTRAPQRLGGLARSLRGVDASLITAASALGGVLIGGYINYQATIKVEKTKVKNAEAAAEATRTAAWRVVENDLKVAHATATMLAEQQNVEPNVQKYIEFFSTAQWEAHQHALAHLPEPEWNRLRGACTVVSLTRMRLATTSVGRDDLEQVRDALEEFKPEWKATRIDS